MPYLPPPAMTATSLNISQFSPTQIQSLVQQLTTQLKVSEPAASPSATISENGVLAPQSSSGKICHLSSILKYENHSFTFQHQCLSTLYSSLSLGSWIIDSGATSMSVVISPCLEISH